MRTYRLDWGNTGIVLVLIICYALVQRAFPLVGLIVAGFAFGSVISRLFPVLTPDALTRMNTAFEAYMKAHRDWEKENLGGCGK